MSRESSASAPAARGLGCAFTALCWAALIAVGCWAWGMEAREAVQYGIVGGLVVVAVPVVVVVGLLAAAAVLWCVGTAMQWWGRRQAAKRAAAFRDRRVN